MWIKIKKKKVDVAPGGTMCQSWWNQRVKEGTLHRGGCEWKKNMQNSFWKADYFFMDSIWHYATVKSIRIPGKDIRLRRWLLPENSRPAWRATQHSWKMLLNLRRLWGGTKRYCGVCWRLESFTFARKTNVNFFCFNAICILEVIIRAIFKLAQKKHKNGYRG